MSFTPKLFEDILNDMISYASGHTTKISDFNEGSITRAILGAVATALEEGYFDTLLGWKDALRYALQRSLDFTRVDGVEARRRARHRWLHTTDPALAAASGASPIRSNHAGAPPRECRRVIQSNHMYHPHSQQSFYLLPA